ncbi:Bifunctional heparan sulfate N-deacetylase/N-sulfotransferase 1 [Nymphon striatum]|nr:Bifunctional heparan sulfate N-deacetylase/N-sulfotransferase 1 [Nymphon striatum]
MADFTPYASNPVNECNEKRSLIQPRIQPTFKCHFAKDVDYQSVQKHDVPISTGQLSIDPKVLVFVETQYSRNGREICAILQALRMKFKIEIAGKSLPLLTKLDKGKYAVIIFENFERYLDMDKWNRELLDKYCRKYDVGIIGFLPHKRGATITNLQLKGFPLFITNNMLLEGYQLNPESPILRITRAGQILHGILPGDWTSFYSNHSSYIPLSTAQSIRDTTFPQHNDTSRITVVQDKGLYDGIQRVIFGHSLQFWIHRLLFIDSLSYLSHGRLSLPLERNILVDIDDIFVGEKGTRMKREDVVALTECQKRLRQLVPGFRFNLGFSGKFLYRGSDTEDDGDDAILENKDNFWWFGHMWSHSQPHIYTNLTLLEAEMRLNYWFAKDHGIPTDSGYAVAPHHSGVFPVHNSLYELWKKVWNVRVSSTEEYPHLKPGRCRRGFIHRNIMVLPRQTCGLYTHTIFFNRYPGGSEKLQNMIHGGELFQTIVFNPINIFMTHLSNYGNDRLAMYTFESVIKFVQCWTHLQLSTIPPLQLAEKYFRMYPEEAEPVWNVVTGLFFQLFTIHAMTNDHMVPCFALLHNMQQATYVSLLRELNPELVPRSIMIDYKLASRNELQENPCNDKRHFSIWSTTKSCKKLPHFLVIGPQKTGTTALYTFLLMHPAIASNFPSRDTFEEIQFFNGKNYIKGLDWYMNFFPIPDNTTGQYLFEKSATYFDAERAPLRAHTLLPDAKLVTILIDPAKRAYSWYQHMRAHGDPVAMKYSFYEVVTATENASRHHRDIRNRCLNPGLYAQHIERWLSYYPSNNLLILDGVSLKLNPVTVMNNVQKFLNIKPYFDFAHHLKFDRSKGFFCQVLGSSNKTKCLGRSKGRLYPQMDFRSEKFLRTYYRSHNIALSQLLSKLGQEIPGWLQQDLARHP